MQEYACIFIHDISTCMFYNDVPFIILFYNYDDEIFQSTCRGSQRHNSWLHSMLSMTSQELRGGYSHNLILVGILALLTVIVVTAGYVVLAGIMLLY